MQLIIPLMLTIFFAKAIGDRYSHGIYDTHIKIRGAPFLVGTSRFCPPHHPYCFAMAYVIQYILNHRFMN